MVLLLYAVVFASHSASDGAIALPEPLDLEYVLRQVDISSHHRLLDSEAEQLTTRSMADAADAAYATEAEINLQANWIDPNPLALDQSNTDHRASLNVRKHLYDFGITGRVDKAYRSLLTASATDVETANAVHRIEIARLYFDVILADMEYGWANEMMAMDYVTLDKKRDKFELKQLDEVELLQEESNYQASLVVRNNASLKQRVTRARLAEALTSSENLPGTLVKPVLTGLHDELADPNELIMQAMQHAPQIKTQGIRVDASRGLFEADSRRWLPSLSAEFEISEYTRELANRERWRAGLNLKVPLYESGLDSAKAAQAYAKMKHEQAVLARLRSSLREDIYTAWQSISTLITKSKAMQTSVDYAERALDKSRGEYELELRTDFGDSQVRLSRSHLDKAINDYQLVIEKMKLALMLGDDPIGVLFPPIKAGT